MTKTPTPKKATPVTFRVVKHGITTGEVLAVVLTGPETRNDDGDVLLPSFAEMTGKGKVMQTWVRHHTRPATPEEFARLAKIMHSHFGPLQPYPKLTNQFRQ